MKGIDLRRIISPMYIKSSEDRETLDILEKILKSKESPRMVLQRERQKREEKKKKMRICCV